MLCTIEISSRGVVPSAFSARTSCPRVVPASRTTDLAFCSSAETAELVTTVVAPGASAFGCETVVWVSTLSSNPPWVIATGPIRTFAPKITVPVRSSITTLATRSGSTVTCSSRATRFTRLSRYWLVT
ncbi:hypothetical protein D3C78_1639380 [compost metagenome]